MTEESRALLREDSSAASVPELCFPREWHSAGYPGHAPVHWGRVGAAIFKLREFELGDFIRAKAGGYPLWTADDYISRSVPARKRPMEG